MPVRKGSIAIESETALRVSALILRRTREKERHSYDPLIDYNVNDYEVLLRYWGSNPFADHLGGFSGPTIVGEEPEATLLKKSKDWTDTLAEQAELSNYKPLNGNKAIFLSIHGGGQPKDPITGKPVKLGVMLSYIIPVKQSDSAVISQYPDLPEYPKFYNLGYALDNMYRGTINIHPYTREMLSGLDHWMREQHVLPGAVNSLFAPPIESRMKMFVPNPLFSTQTEDFLTPNQSMIEDDPPLLSSTPFNAAEDTTLMLSPAPVETSVRAARHSVAASFQQHHPVDMIVKNPLFGSGLCFKKVNMQIVNTHFGCGEPNYNAIRENSGKWLVQIQSDGLPDWTELFPLHKYSCEGDVEEVRECLKRGVAADERDIDTWTPLHYACWYGELEVVKVLVEEGSAKIGILNSSGSSPLHLAASNGRPEVVAYLLSRKEGMEIMGSLDNDGKTPLDVCLESKSNYWKATSELLEEAYQECQHSADPYPPSLLPYSPPPPPMEDLTVLSSGPISLLKEEHLELTGSLGDLTETTHLVKAPKKSRRKPKEQKVSRTIRRQRINFGINQHQVVHFFHGRETTCSNILMDLYRLVKVPLEYHSLFSLWLSSKGLELLLSETDQPLKIFYSWKKVVSQYSGHKGEEEPPSIYLWRNTLYPPQKEKMISDSTVLELLYADAHRHVVNSHYPCSEEDLCYLTGITLQITYGDYNEVVHNAGFLKDKLEKLLPSYALFSKRRAETEKSILAKYSEISHFKFEDMKYLFQHYLKHCWQWPYYGASFFEGILFTKSAKLESKENLTRKSQIPVRIGINTDGFHIISMDTNKLLATLGFDGLDWDMAAAKQELTISSKSGNIFAQIYCKKVTLMYDLATKIREKLPFNI